MSTYQGHEFKVVPFQGRWPLIERDSEGVPWYRATIEMFDETDYKNLADLVVQGQPIMAGGLFRGKVRIGRKKNLSTIAEGELIVPIRRSEYGIFNAVLLKFSPETYGHLNQRFRADAEWCVTAEDITP
jgi:hypothetical protein